MQQMTSTRSLEREKRMEGVERVDVAIVGAGPVGLGFARSLSGSGLSVRLLEKQPLDALRVPAFDGREIALTHTSRGLLQALDIWGRIAPGEISPLRDARVLNGPSLFALDITAGDGRESELGWLVPNDLIRKAAYDSVADCADVGIQAGVSVKSIEQVEDAVRLGLDDGGSVDARLVVAADSRFSGTRRMMGIGAQMRDFGKTMMVCRVSHEHPHGHVAWEWFDYGQTLALLPLNGDRASVVLTLPQREMQGLQAMDDRVLGRDFERRFDGRLGWMDVISRPHCYPLVGVYADRFVGPRYALLGDAAVGMHPVTAHGFNFGLLGQARLSREILRAHRRGEDFAAPTVLACYQRGHRLATRPLYLATQMIAGLYTDDRVPARLVRTTALRLAHHVAPFRQLIAGHLTRG